MHFQAKSILKNNYHHDYSVNYLLYTGLMSIALAKKLVVFGLGVSWYFHTGYS
jgi:hypothetical protein